MKNLNHYGFIASLCVPPLGLLGLAYRAFDAIEFCSLVVFACVSACVFIYRISQE